MAAEFIALVAKEDFWRGPAGLWRFVCYGLGFPSSQHRSRAVQKSFSRSSSLEKTSLLAVPMETCTACIDAAANSMACFSVRSGALTGWARFIIIHSAHRVCMFSVDHHSYNGHFYFVEKLRIDLRPLADTFLLYCEQMQKLGETQCLFIFSFTLCLLILRLKVLVCTQEHSCSYL